MFNSHIGTRAQSSVFIYIDIAQAMADGMVFYIAKNGVILTEGFSGQLPSKYFQRIEDERGS